MGEFTDILRSEFGEDEPILIQEIIEEFPDVSRVTAFVRLKGAIDDGSIERYGWGIYYIPREGNMGSVPLSPLKVIRKKYLRNGDEVVGYISGLNLENDIGISPQVPATMEITTNMASKRRREIEPFGGWRTITLKSPRTTVNKDNVDALRFLDLITRISLKALSRLELDNLKKFADKVDRDQVLKCISYYPSKTSKQFLESESLGVLTRGSGSLSGIGLPIERSA